MQLYASNHMAEIQWWRSGIETNYFIILDVRNEAAVAALALRNWSLYYYKNEIYTRLNKLMAQDARLDRYADDLQSANTQQAHRAHHLRRIRRRRPAHLLLHLLPTPGAAHLCAPADS
jgi:hypothetical protein